MRKLFYLLPLYLIILSCGIFEGDDPEPESSAEEIIAMGWMNFESGLYQDAIGDFNDALIKDPNALEAYSGLGWSYIRIKSIENAESNFLTALNENYAGVEMLAGLSAISLAWGQYLDAIEYAESVISANSAWVFEHDSNINFKDIWYIAAIAYFHEGELDEVESAILHIDNGFSIFADDPSTWVINEQVFDTYIEVIAAYLQNLASELII